MANINTNKMSGLPDVTLEMLKKFAPLIEKYSRKLNYDGAVTDLTIAFIEMLNKLPPGKCERIITSYVAKSVKNEYIKLSKKNSLIRQREIPFNMEHINNPITDMEDSIDIENAITTLTAKQRTVIELSIYQGYTDTEIALKLDVTKQAINRTKGAAFAKIKAYLSMEEKGGIY